MGEPATPNAKERAETQALAAKIVQSVRDDEAMPLPGLVHDEYSRNDSFMPEGVEALAFQLAQEIELLRDEVARLGDLVDILEHRDAERERGR